MDEISEIYVACIIEYARRNQDGVLVGPFFVLGKDVRDAFNLPYSERIFGDAIEILERLGALTQYKRKGMQTFYRIEAKRFDEAMAKSKDPFFDRNYMHRAFESGPMEYKFLEAFNDIGTRYLSEALDSYSDDIYRLAEDTSNEDNFEGAVDESVIDSATWTGLPDQFSLSEEHRLQIVRELDRLENEIPRSGAAQEQQAQARALIVATRALLEAPDPQFDLAWEMIGRANNLAGIASLFVSIIALFLTAAH